MNAKRSAGRGCWSPYRRLQCWSLGWSMQCRWQKGGRTLGELGSYGECKDGSGGSCLFQGMKGRGREGLSEAGNLTYRCGQPSDSAGSAFNQLQIENIWRHASVLNMFISSLLTIIINIQQNNCLDSINCSGCYK